MGLLERMRKKEEDEETPEEALAHDALEYFEDKLRQVSPTRVLFASIAALLMISASLIVVAWVVPYDRVSVDVVYRQGAAGHVVLAQINNEGSRSIEEVSLDIRFLDSEGIVEIDRAHYDVEVITAHTSVAGDELELIVPGFSVWDNYTIEIILSYDNYRNGVYVKEPYSVGEWTMELYTVKSPLKIL